jgi:Fe2+ or Zn2+ uptake regulation protein
MDHPTAAWSTRRLARLPRIGLGTVYRNLKHLAEGLIREIREAWSRAV